MAIKVPTKYQDYNNPGIWRSNDQVRFIYKIGGTFKTMNGWLIIFAMISVAGGIWGTSAQAPSAVLTSVLFAILFFLGVCARAVRAAVC